MHFLIESFEQSTCAEAAIFAHALKVVHPYGRDRGAPARGHPGNGSAPYQDGHGAHALQWSACIGEAAMRMCARTQRMALLGESLINAHVQGCCCLPVRDLF